MDPNHLFIDDRFLDHMCVFCGGPPESRDHVPSKAFLREPWPEQLPVVEACVECNHGFSLDEEYFACFLEVVLFGTADPSQLSRPNVKRALERNTKLRELIEQSLHPDETGRKIWQPDIERIRRVVLKLARGHAAYELSLPQLEEPLSIGITPFLSMTDESRAQFESSGSEEVAAWPEVGSRAFLRAADAFRAVAADSPADASGSWVKIQPNIYRYRVDQDEGVNVRIVFCEYLACEVGWE